MKESATKECIAAVPVPLGAARKAFSRSLKDRDFVKAVNSVSTITAVEGFDFKAFDGEYLVSGDRGIHAIIGGSLLKLFGIRTFGIALRGRELLTACSNDHYSSICRTELPEKLEPGLDLRFKEIFRTPTSKSGRIHQIGFFNDQLAVAHTDANAILFLDPATGKTISKCQPFRDHFGFPISGDHNHINSVSQCGESLLFCAYRAGENSLLCILKDNHVKGYPVANPGVHDIHITGKKLYYCDTFGKPSGETEDECGYLMEDNRPVDAAFFGKPPGRAVRGIAAHGKELLVGHSHKGPRAKRYKGKGSIFRIVNGKVTDEVTVPFSQVYDIMRTDGLHFEEPGAFRTFSELDAFFTGLLGPCTYERHLD